MKNKFEIYKREIEDKLYAQAPDRFNELKSAVRNVRQEANARRVLVPVRSAFIYAIVFILLSLTVYSIYSLNQPTPLVPDKSKDNSSHSAALSTASGSTGNIGSSQKDSPGGVTLQYAADALSLPLREPAFFSEKETAPPVISLRNDIDHQAYSVIFQYDSGSIQVSKTRINIPKEEFSAAMIGDMPILYRDDHGSVEIYCETARIYYFISFQDISLDEGIAILRSIIIE